MTTTLLALDRQLWLAHDTYVEEHDNAAVQKIESIIADLRGMMEAKVTEFNIFNALMTQLHPASTSNRYSEVSQNAYKIVENEYRKSQRAITSKGLAKAEAEANENATPAPSPVFNIARELEKANALTMELQAVMNGIAIAVAAEAAK